MMPQRVPYSTHEVPARAPAAAGVAAGYVHSRAAFSSGGPDVMQHHMVPDSPESYAHSDTSGAGEGAVGLDHRGVATRCAFAVADMLC